MLKSFDLSGGNFTEFLNVGVVSALGTPVALHNIQHSNNNNNNNLTTLMNINQINNKIALDQSNVSMKSTKTRPHPYLLREQQHQLHHTLLQPQPAVLQIQQQQLSHLHQLHQSHQRQHHYHRAIKEAPTSVPAVTLPANTAVSAVASAAVSNKIDAGVGSSVVGFGLSNMNVSTEGAGSAVVVSVGGGNGNGCGNAELPTASPMNAIKREPEVFVPNDANITEQTVENLAEGGSSNIAVETLSQSTSTNTINNDSGNETICMEIALRDDENDDNDDFEKDQPDPDNIKMFVGQIPKTMDETQLKKMFEQYGRVHTINVLRDKLTTQSRGCCFVTYYTRKAALKAQDALHNIKTLNGMHHPIQMKPADSENRNERKLFVGMLNKKYNESEVRQLFAGHGTIEECTVLRDQNGQSKGCAFVTFSTKQAAIGAIKGLHQSQTMEGCSAPLVVKFADTQKEKDQKKLQHLQATLCGNGLTTNPVSTASIITRSNPTVQALAAPSLAQSAAAIAATPSLIAANPPQQTSPYLATDALATPSQMQYFQQLQAFGIHPQFLQGLNFPPDHSATALSAASGLIAPMSMQSLVSLSALNPSQNQFHQSHHQHQHFGHPHLSAAVPASPTQSIPAQLATTPPGSTALWTGTDALANPYAQSLTHLTNGTFAAATAPLTASALSAAAAGVAGKQIEGPEGSNLFIYHLPQEFNDTDLASTFLPFGNVLSAKVFIDKQTNLSKCFGFVSFDNPHSANAAIQAMHGFQIGTKRLKVQLKRSKDAAKPY